MIVARMRISRAPSLHVLHYLFFLVFFCSFLVAFSVTYPEGGAHPKRKAITIALATPALERDFERSQAPNRKERGKVRKK